MRATHFAILITLTLGLGGCHPSPSGSAAAGGHDCASAGGAGCEVAATRGNDGEDPYAALVAQDVQAIIAGMRDLD